MSYSKQDTQDLEAQVARIRAKRNSGPINRDKLRLVLNTLFMVIALAGVLIYFIYPSRHIPALCIIGAAMLIKVAEFILRMIS